MRRVSVIALLLLGGCAAALADSPAKPERPLDGAIAHTMLLKDPGCTGVRIGGGLVVTAKHCMNERVVGDLYTGLTVGYISPDHDFAVLKGDAPVMAVWMRDARIGDHLYIIGYPQSIDDEKQYLTVTDGVFTGVTDANLERVTAYSYYGNSGGGVWDDDGALLGLLVEGRRTSSTVGGYPVFLPAHSYIVPVRFIRSVVL